MALFFFALALLFKFWSLFITDILVHTNETQSLELRYDYQDTVDWDSNRYKEGNGDRPCDFVWSEEVEHYAHEDEDSESVNCFLDTEGDE